MTVYAFSVIRTLGSRKANDNILLTVMSWLVSYLEDCSSRSCAVDFCVCTLVSSSVQLQLLARLCVCAERLCVSVLKSNFMVRDSVRWLNLCSSNQCSHLTCLHIFCSTFFALVFCLGFFISLACVRLSSLIVNFWTIWFFERMLALVGNSPHSRHRLYTVRLLRALYLYTITFPVVEIVNRLVISPSRQSAGLN